jgi:hypothetical protein
MNRFLDQSGIAQANSTRPRASDALAILVSAVTPPNLCPPGTGAFDA